MKRDWDIIREILIEIQDCPRAERDDITYELSEDSGHADALKNEHALLLWKAGFISAIDIGSTDGDGIMSPDLTWAGHDLLATINSQPIWERIKTTAKDKGIELTFDAVKVLSKLALDWVLKSS